MNQIMNSFTAETLRRNDTQQYPIKFPCEPLGICASHITKQLSLMQGLYSPIGIFFLHSSVISECIPQRSLRFCIFVSYILPLRIYKTIVNLNLAVTYIFNAETAEEIHTEKMQRGKTFKPCSISYATLFN